MEVKKVENLIGALSMAIADEIQQAAQNHIEVSAPAAAITLVDHLPGLTIDQLSRALKLSHPGTVRLVDRLENKGLLERRRSLQDARAVTLFLTPQGTKVCQRVHHSRQSVIEDALNSLSAEELDTIGGFAEKLLRKILRNEDHAVQICRLCDVTVCTDCPVESEIISRDLEGQP